MRDSAVPLGRRLCRKVAGFWAVGSCSFHSLGRRFLNVTVGYFWRRVAVFGWSWRSSCLRRDSE